jgi:DNA-binding response OmpR family regulator
MDTLSSYQPRLIFVDDEMDLHDMVVDYLERENWTVCTASGKSLDALLEQEDADLITRPCAAPVAALTAPALASCRMVRSQNLFSGPLALSYCRP